MSARSICNMYNFMTCPLYLEKDRRVQRGNNRGRAAPASIRLFHCPRFGAAFFWVFAKKCRHREKQKREKLHGRQRGSDRFHRPPRRSRLRRRSTYKSARVFPSYQHCKLKMRQAEERPGQFGHENRGEKTFIRPREPRAEINTPASHCFAG